MSQKTISRNRFHCIKMPAPGKSVYRQHKEHKVVKMHINNVPKEHFAKRCFILQPTGVKNQIFFFSQWTQKQQVGETLLSDMQQT